MQHERDQYDSLRKLELLSSVCKGLGVHTSPCQVGGVWIVPLLSWYHGCWDREPDVDGATPIHKASRSVALRRLQRLTAGRRLAYGARQAAAAAAGPRTRARRPRAPPSSPPFQVMLDFHVCSWRSVPGLSAHDTTLAAHFDRMNDPSFDEALREIEAEEAATGRRPPVISASHFLPRQVGGLGVGGDGGSGKLARGGGQAAAGRELAGLGWHCGVKQAPLRARRHMACQLRAALAPAFPLLRTPSHPPQRYY